MYMEMRAIDPAHNTRKHVYDVLPTDISRMTRHVKHNGGKHGLYGRRVSLDVADTSPSLFRPIVGIPLPWYNSHHELVYRVH